MKVICKGYRTCTLKDDCHHKKAHDHITQCEPAGSEFLEFPECECISIAIIRKDKLENINKNIETFGKNRIF